jgi:putative two-component system response regulator
MESFKKNYKALLVSNNQSLIDDVVSILKIKDIECEFTKSVEDSKKLIDNNGTIDLLITDYEIDDSKGLEVVEYIKDKFPNIPIIVISSSKDEIKMKSLVAGANTILNFPFRETELLMTANNLVTLSEAYEELEHSGHVILALCRALEARDIYTEGHSERVARLSLEIFDKYGLKDKHQRERLYTGALLHDIGKIAIEDNVLRSEKRFDKNSEEFKQIMSHPEKGYNICIDLEKLRSCLDVVLYHHERLDGSGYPCGAKDDQIPINAQIVSIADVYDALTSNRSYRMKMLPSEALKIIHEESKNNKLNLELFMVLKNIIEEESVV